jgi:type IV pilus assembly protein PilO
VETLKKWTALAVVAALVILAGGWFLLVSPKRSNAADLRAQAVEKQRSIQGLQTQLAVLKAQAKDLPKQQAKLAAVAAKIPSDPAMPALVRALNKAASDANVELVSMAPGMPTASTAAAVSSPATASTARTGAAAGSLQQISVTLNVVGSYFQVAEYLDRLEGLTRAFRVSGFTLAPGANPVKATAGQATADSGKVLNANITGLVFETPGATTSALTAGK